MTTGNKICKNDPVFKGNGKALLRPGRLYFALKSGRWSNGGIAFFDPVGEGNVQMRLYKVSRAQFDHLCEEEGVVYANKLCLGIGADDLPIYTLTSEAPCAGENMPSPEYSACICEGLQQCDSSEEAAKEYLASWVNHLK